MIEELASSSSSSSSSSFSCSFSFLLLFKSPSYQIHSNTKAIIFNLVNCLMLMYSYHNIILLKSEATEDHHRRSYKKVGEDGDDFNCKSFPWVNRATSEENNGICLTRQTIWLIINVINMSFVGVFLLCAFQINFMKK